MAAENVEMTAHQFLELAETWGTAGAVAAVAHDGARVQPQRLNDLIMTAAQNPRLHASAIAEIEKFLVEGLVC